MSSKEAVFNLSVILENAGFDAKARRRIKLIRHTQKSLKEAYPDYIEYYQAEQKPSTFRTVTTFSASSEKKVTLQGFSVLLRQFTVIFQ